jgi:hypothetical protein
LPCGHAFAFLNSQDLIRLDIPDDVREAAGPENFQTFCADVCETRNTEFPPTPVIRGILDLVF